MLKLLNTSSDPTALSTDNPLNPEKKLNPELTTNMLKNTLLNKKTEKKPPRKEDTKFKKKPTLLVNTKPTPRRPKLDKPSLRKFFLINKNVNPHD